MISCVNLEWLFDALEPGSSLGSETDCLQYVGLLYSVTVVYMSAVRNSDVTCDI
jgi:hypothetical protein